MKIQYPLMAALAAFVGCSQYIPSVGPDYVEPTLQDIRYPVPDAGSVTNADTRAVLAGAAPREWWKRFDDPVLTGLVSSAVTNNLNFLMAVRRLEQAGYELLGSYAAFLPKFAAGAGWNRNWLHKDAASSGVRQHYNGQSVVLDGDWEIDVFGGNRREAEAALAQLEAAGWSAEDAWIELTSQIAQRYIQLRTTQERIAVARTNLRLQTETYVILKSRLDSGIGDELAVNQCAYIVEQTRAKIPSMLAQEELLKNTITILAGEVPGALHERLQPLGAPRDWMLEPQKVSELPLDWIRARPDVRKAERELAAQCAYIGVAKAQWFPHLFLTGQVGWQNANGHRLFETDSFFANLGPAVSWPIFQGGAIYANVKATELKTEQAALAYEQSVQNAYADVRNAYSSYTQEYHRYEALKLAVKAATDAVTISQDLYKNGLKDFNNVLDAQRSRLQLEEEFVISRGQITQNLIVLYKSLGGGLAADR